MNRRAFLLRTGGGVLAAVAGGLWLRRTTIPTPDVPAMLAELKGWRGRSVTTKGRALERLITALQSFHDFTEELRPHFAYSALSKAEYAAAHIMHIRDHRREFTAGG